MTANIPFRDLSIGARIVYTPTDASEPCEGEFRGVAARTHTGAVRTLRISFGRGCQLVQAERCSWPEDG